MGDFATAAERDNGTPEVALANTVPIPMTSSPTSNFDVVDRNIVMEWGRNTRYGFIGSKVEVKYCIDHACACVQGNEFVGDNVWIYRTHTSGLSSS